MPEKKKAAAKAKKVSRGAVKKKPPARKPRHLSPNTANLSNDAGARAEVLRKCCKELDRIDREMGELREQRRDIVKVRIVGELGMKAADFNASRRLIGLDRERRDIMLDTCRECFDALGVGDQLDWLQVADRARQIKIEAASSEDAGFGKEPGPNPTRDETTGPF